MKWAWQFVLVLERDCEEQKGGQLPRLVCEWHLPWLWKACLAPGADPESQKDGLGAGAPLTHHVWERDNGKCS